MSIRSVLSVGLVSASIALLPVTNAQAGEDEEVFALGAAAGAAAVIILGAIGVGVNRAQDRGTVQPLAYGPDGRSNAHIAYCQQRYRTYRVSDGTFQPNNGPRRLCVSPYAS